MVSRVEFGTSVAPVLSAETATTCHLFKVENISINDRATFVSCLISLVRDRKSKIAVYICYDNSIVCQDPILW